MPSWSRPCACCGEPHDVYDWPMDHRPHEQTWVGKRDPETGEMRIYGWARGKYKVLVKYKEDPCTTP